jgi:hypothetical protein
VESQFFGGGRCVVCTRIEEELALSFIFGGHGFFRVTFQRGKVLI